VQFFGNVSARVADLKPGESREISLSRGPYDVAVQDGDGAVVENTRILVTDKGYRFDLGCVPKAVKSVVDDRKAVRVWFANTSGDCGTPEAVELRLNGVSYGIVADGALTRVAVPSKDVLMEVVREGKRLFAEWFDTLKDGGTVFFGCTDPAIRRPSSGVTVFFQNSTDQCGAGGGRYLTLKVDGMTKVGLSPGGRTSIVLKRGAHDLAVYAGMSREVLLKGRRNVTKSFRIHYGCGK